MIDKLIKSLVLIGLLLIQGYSADNEDIIYGDVAIVEENCEIIKYLYPDVLTNKYLAFSILNHQSLFMKNKLLKLGFTNNETIIFETLVIYGDLGANDISRKVGIDRSVVYNILDNLIMKGYVSQINKQGKKRFFINTLDY